MTTANKITRYSWGMDYITRTRFVTFERANTGERTHDDPSVGSWSRLMRAMTVARLKPNVQWILRQRAMMEYIDRKAEQAQAKRR